MRILPRVQHGVSAARCGLAAGMRSRLQRLLLALPFLFGLLIVPAAAGAPLSTGDGGWVWQDPMPQGNLLAALALADAEHGWAAGSAGTIIATTDGGATWKGQVSHTREELRDIAFTDSVHGWAVGYSGTIVATKDGGRSWRAQDSCTTDLLLAVAFADNLHGWAANPDGDIFATDDGGQNWMKRASDAGLVNALAFTDASHGWAVGPFGNILATSDGGAHWTQQNWNVGYSLNDVTFTDADHGWAVGATPWTPAVGKQEPIVLATSDGGAHWSEQSAPSGQDGRRLYSVSFVDASHGWTSGDGLLVTQDGGQTWTAEAGAPGGLIAFGDALHGMAVRNAGIFATGDGGKTWTPESDQMAGSLYAVSFLDLSHGCAVGMSGSSYTTSDGGQHWSGDRVSGSDLEAVAYRDPAHVFAAGWGIWNLTDGLGVWGGQGMSGITFANADDGWAVGGSGKILATTDGGATWGTQYSGVTDSLNAVDFPDAEHGWAVGGSGTILATADGGQTWAPQTSGTGAYFRAVAVTDASRGWVVGDGAGGGIFATTDGGSTWVRQYSGEYTGGEPLCGVACTDADHVWAVGIAGTIVATVDGGDSWVAQNSGTEENLLGVSFVDSSHGWVVGYDGTILTTTTGGFPTADVTPPTTAVSGADGQWRNRPVVLTLLAADNAGGSGMAAGSAMTEYKIDDGPWTSGTSVTVPAPADHSGDGVHTVRYHSYDAAGNSETIGSVTVRIDTTAPVASASGVADGAWLRGAASIGLSANDGGSGVASITYALEGVAQTMADASATVAIPGSPDATHVLRYHATDVAGNVGGEQQLTVHVDTVGPATAGKAVSGRRGTYLRMRYRATDNLSPKVWVRKIVVKNSRGRIVRTFTTVARTARTPGAWYSVKWRPSARGTYRYYVYAKDLAGNAQSKVGSARVDVR